MALVKTILNGNEVEYDDKEFKLKQDELGNAYLNYIGDGKNIINPKGNTSCRNMFDGCDYLEELDLSNFDTTNVVDMSNMFYYCKSLKTLDLSNFDTSKVKDMSHMFDGCCALRYLDLSRFNTLKVEDMSYMFCECDLDEVDLINFETFNVKNFECMFSGCEHLGILDIDMFEVSEDSNVDGMFSNCVNLMDLYINEDALSVVEKGKDVFNCCYNINIIKTCNLNLRVLELDLWRGVSEKDAYKKQKDKYATSDPDFINILYKVRPNSTMISSYVSRVLVPKIEKCFTEGMSVREVRKTLYKEYNTSLLNDALVSYLKCFYIVGLDTKSITYENSESLLDSKCRNASAIYSNGNERLKEDNKIEDLARKKIENYFSFVDGNSSVTVGKVIEKSYENFNKRFVDETILSILGNEKF